MKNYLLVLMCTGLLGCAQQQPVKVVAALPSTYTPKLQLKAQNSMVSARIATATSKPAWMWPAKGSILSRFAGPKPGFKGIDILGIEGAPVVAAADGEVVYSGNSLQDYGNLIIIKHKKNFLTAYAHNKKNMVKEGDRVIMGQRIAEMGKSGTNQVKLHFEVRQDGKPIDPQGVLPKR